MKKGLYIAVLACVIFGIYKMQTAQFTVDYGNNRTENLITTTPLGNALSAYFYYLGAKHDKTILSRHQQFMQAYIDPELKEFYKTLNWRYSIKSVPFESDSRSAWNQINLDGTYKQNYLRFWQNVRPLMQQIYASALPQVTVSDPVVHFRCSDVPFNKHRQYHLAPRSSVKWVAEQIKARGYNNIILLACNSHLNPEPKSCDRYADFYRQEFIATGLTVQMQCGSIFSDFAAMVQSPLLVSLNEGSFSFLAGVAKDPNTYISCNMGMEVGDKYVLQTEADWILYMQEPLLHARVDDYTQTDKVIAQLVKQ